MMVMMIRAGRLFGANVEGESGEERRVGIYDGDEEGERVSRY